MGDVHRSPVIQRPVGGFGRNLLSACLYILAGVMLAGAVVLGSARIFLPELRHYRPEVQAWVSRLIGEQVEIGNIDAYWRGWIPEIRVENVRLIVSEMPDGKGYAPLRSADLTFSIDPLASLWSGMPQTRRIVISGASFVVVRRSDGGFSVQGFGDISDRELRSSTRLAQWLLNQANISLHSSHITWLDEQRRMRALPLTNVNLHLQHEYDRHRISGSFELPGTTRGELAFSAAVTGDLLTSSWSGTVYINAAGVDLERIGLDARKFGGERFSGHVSGTVWSTWRSARLVEAEGAMRAQSIGVVGGARRRELDEVGATLKIERITEGWALAVRDLVVATRNGLWPRSMVDARWTVPRDGQNGSIVVSTDFTRVEDLVALIPADKASLANPVLDALIAANPHGTLERLHLSIPLTDSFILEQTKIRGRFTRLRFDAQDPPISLGAVSGRFEASAQGLVVEVTTGRLEVGATPWLARSVQGEGFAGTFIAIPSLEGIRFRFEDVTLATSVGMVGAQGWVFAPHDDGEPELSVILNLGASKVAAVYALLPPGTLDDSVADWLDSAVPDADISKARLLFHGALSDPPFNPGTARFEATMNVGLPVLRYNPEWPEIADVMGVVRFDGVRLDTRVDSGRVFASSIRKLETTIEDVDAEVPVARVIGQFEGTSPDAMRFLAESPLREQFSGVIEDIGFDGDNTITLALDVPLTLEDYPVTVQGEIALDHNRIDVPGLARGLEAVTGVVAFQDDGIASTGLTATYLGEPLDIVIGAAPQPASTTRLTIEGRATRRQLAAHLHNTGLTDTPRLEDLKFFTRIHGSARWQAIFDFPHTPETGSFDVRLQAVTDLVGIGLELPSPFGKTHGSARRLQIETRFIPGVEDTGFHDTEIHYGDLASAVFRSVGGGDPSQFRLERGAIRFNDGDAALPQTSGITVRGELPVLDVDAWRTLLEEIAPHDAADVRAPPLMAVRELSIDAGSVTMIGARFPDVKLRGVHSADGGWRLVLAGDSLTGAIRIPPDLGVESVTVDFKHVVFETEPESDIGEASAAKDRIDPRILPALSFSTEHLVFDGLEFKDVRFKAVPYEHGLRFERLQARAASFSSSTAGSWSFVDGVHYTAIDAQADGDDLGGMLNALGFDGSVAIGGETRIRLRGSWAGTPANFALDRLRGTLEFHSSGGRLIQVERGIVGRAFGLLTLTSLSRRLILDFGDFFQSGLEYDLFEGSFAIEDGNAYADTNPVFIENDTARIEITGRTGLVVKDYDKLVTVIPKISSSLPFAPVWIVEKLLNRQVFDQAFAYQYTITGSQDDPVITPVRTPVINKQPQSRG